MSETDAVKLFGHRKWGGNTQHIFVFAPPVKGGSSIVGSVLSATADDYLTRPFCLTEIDEDIREKLPIYAGQAVAC
jgi:hypothetical protein